jgi:acylaminoacyl-peptidase
MKRKSISIEDLYGLKFIREISLSPDGTQIAYTVEWMDKKENKYYTNLYVVNRKGRSRQFIRGNRNIRLPRWSPNGRFISFIQTDIKKNEAKQALWVIPSDGGEAYAVTKEEGFFGSYSWTPDSRYAICEFTEHKIDKDRVPDRGKPPLYFYVKRPWYKLDGKGMLPKERPHIWKVNMRSGSMTQLTKHPNGDGDPAVSPDGKSIAYITNIHDDFEEKLLYSDIFVMDMNGKKQRKIKTPQGPKQVVAFSPDGKNLVYIGREHPDEFVGWRLSYVYRVPIKGGKAVNLTRSFDRTFSALVVDDLGHYAQNVPVFSSDGRFVYLPTADRGSVNLYGIDTKLRKVVKVCGDREVVYAFDHDGQNTFAIASSNPVDAGNIYILHNGKRKQLTDINARFNKSRSTAKPEEFWFRGDNGDRVQGWVLKPPRFSVRKKYPLIVQIHGGPHAAYGYSLFHEFQVLAAQGYVVFYSNPHGSIGYGEGFARALHLKWGIPDTKDIMKAVRIMKKRSYIDGKRTGVMGGSYGGFMTNWIIGHTNAFKVAVTMRSVVNMLSFFSSDFGFALAREFKGPWWEKKNFKFYWDMSPLKYVTKMRTPLLIIHSEQDHRCPISQGEELFVALKELKREVEMVRFPLEPHGLSRHGSPRRREKRLKFIVDFVDRHMKK